MGDFFSSKGIIISKIKFKETSYILKVFTEKFGLLSVMVYGARKQNSKYLGFFNVMNELHFDLIKSANSDIYLLRDVDFIRFFLEGISYKKQSYFYIVSELVRKIYTDEYDTIYNLIIKYYESLIGSKISKIYLFWRFLSKFFLILGNPIMINNCHICGQKIKSRMFYSLRGDGLVCENCQKNQTYLNEIGEEAKFVLNNFHRIGKIDSGISEKTIKEINAIFLIHLKTHFHQDLNLSLLNDLW